MVEQNMEKFIKEQRNTLDTGTSGVTLHTLESSGYFITIVDEHSEQLISVTEAELEKIYELLKKKYDNSN